jgi:choline dehydrogenase-like flavoprotein
MRRYRHYASMEVAIRDDASGRISVDRQGKIRIDKRFTAEDRRKSEQGLALVRELFQAAGAREVVTCTQGFGLHLMGGCAIGADPGRAVVDPEFRVHGLPNLYAADSSVFPSAPGINPSFTIMALSHRASRSMLGKGGVA